MDRPIFRTQGLTKVYDTGSPRVHALAGLDMGLFGGERAVLLGPSGSGKSTLLNILGGLDHATSGRVWVRDTDLTALGDRGLTRCRRDHVGFVVRSYNRVARLSARENVQLGTDGARDPMPPDAALALVGLPHRPGHSPAEQSGGEQQRVAIARAIATRPGVLWCDEPTGALDSKTGVQVPKALRDIDDRFGPTTVVIIHNAGIRRTAHRVARFQDGRIAGGAAWRRCWAGWTRACGGSPTRRTRWPMAGPWSTARRVSNAAARTGRPAAPCVRNRG